MHLEILDGCSQYGRKRRASLRTQLYSDFIHSLDQTSRKSKSVARRRDSLSKPTNGLLYTETDACSLPLHDSLVVKRTRKRRTIKDSCADLEEISNPAVALDEIVSPSRFDTFEKSFTSQSENDKSSIPASLAFGCSSEVDSEGMPINALEEVIPVPSCFQSSNLSTLSFKFIERCRKLLHQSCNFTSTLSSILETIIKVNQRIISTQDHNLNQNICITIICAVTIGGISTSSMQASDIVDSNLVEVIQAASCLFPSQGSICDNHHQDSYSTHSPPNTSKRKIRFSSVSGDSTSPSNDRRPQSVQAMMTATRELTSVIIRFEDFLSLSAKLRHESIVMGLYLISHKDVLDLLYTPLLEAISSASAGPVTALPEYSDLRRLAQKLFCEMYLPLYKNSKPENHTEMLEPELLEYFCSLCQPLISPGSTSHLPGPRTPLRYDLSTHASAVIRHHLRWLLDEPPYTISSRHTSTRSAQLVLHTGSSAFVPCEDSLRSASAETRSGLHVLIEKTFPPEWVVNSPSLISCIASNQQELTDAPLSSLLTQALRQIRTLLLETHYWRRKAGCPREAEANVRYSSSSSLPSASQADSCTTTCASDTMDSLLYVDTSLTRSEPVQQIRGWSQSRTEYEVVDEEVTLRSKSGMVSSRKAVWAVLLDLVDRVAVELDDTVVGFVGPQEVPSVVMYEDTGEDAGLEDESTVLEMSNTADNSCSECCIDGELDSLFEEVDPPGPPLVLLVDSGNAPSASSELGHTHIIPELADYVETGPARAGTSVESTSITPRKDDVDIVTPETLLDNTSFVDAWVSSILESLTCPCDPSSLSYLLQCIQVILSGYSAVHFVKNILELAPLEAITKESGLWIVVEEFAGYINRFGFEEDLHLSLLHNTCRLQAPTFEPSRWMTSANLNSCMEVVAFFNDMLRDKASRKALRGKKAKTGKNSNTRLTSKECQDVNNSDSSQGLSSEEHFRIRLSDLRNSVSERILSECRNIRQDLLEQIVLCDFIFMFPSVTERSIL